jgi:GNAT superfamily N-acetyltransferase
MPRAAWRRAPLPGVEASRRACYSLAVTEARPHALLARAATEQDLDEVASMVDDFVKDHPARSHPRSREGLRSAFFGDRRVAELVVAEWRGRVVGMAQWRRVYDMFWDMYGGQAEFLYVRPHARGRGAALALGATICARVRASGGQFLYGSGTATTTPLYERVMIAGGQTTECHLSGEAFATLADLAGRSVRDMVRNLPAPELNRQPVRPRP